MIFGIRKCGMTNIQNISPVASRVIAKCGGIEKTALAVGRSESWIYRWTYPKGKRGGTGGEVPKSAQQILVFKGLCEPSDFFERSQEKAS